MNNVVLKSLHNSDCDKIVIVLQQFESNKPQSPLQQYFDKIQQSMDHVLIARDNQRFDGSVNFNYLPQYNDFTYV